MSRGRAVCGGVVCSGNGRSGLGLKVLSRVEVGEVGFEVAFNRAMRYL
jgi:hypothetical protein